MSMQEIQIEIGNQCAMAGLIIVAIVMIVFCVLIWLDGGKDENEN